VGFVALVPIVVLVVALAIDIWIYEDAKAQADRGMPVVLSWGALRLETPTAWIIACLLVWIVFVPLYLVGRRS
jgi:hypothetical protein